MKILEIQILAIHWYRDKQFSGAFSKNILTKEDVSLVIVRFHGLICLPVTDPSRSRLRTLPELQGRTPCSQENDEDQQGVGTKELQEDSSKVHHAFSKCHVS